MTTAVQFRQATADANSALTADKGKLKWSRLSFDDMPRDIAVLAVQAVDTEIGARQAKASLQAALDDKVQQRPGQRLVVTLGRDVGPNTDGVLIAWASALSSGTKTITFDQFIKG